MKNKVLAMLLALCMVMSLLPVAVFADNEPVQCTGSADVTNCQAETHTGSCPQKCTCANGTQNECNHATGCTNSKAQDSEFCATCKDKQPQQGGNQQGGNQQGGNEQGGNQARPCGDNACVAENANHTGPHEYTCACDLENCTYSKHTTEHVSKPGDICSGCKAAIAMAEAAANDPANRDCSEGGQQNAQKTNCGASTHYANCPKKCDAVAACTKTKGHTDKHNDTTNCSGDAQCAATANHDADCPNYTTPADAPDENDNTKMMRTERLSKVYEVEVTCSCQGPHSQNEPYLHPHVVVSGAHTSDPFKIKVTVYEEIKYEVKYKQNSTEEDATATAAERATAVQGATLAAPQANAIPDADKLCDYCKAAIAAEEAKDEAEAYADCNMTAECQKGVEGAKHNDDCLSLCTMNDSCKNTAGDANAHVVKYAVIKTTTTYKNVVEDQGQVTNPGVVDDETPATTTEVFKFLTYAEARAYVDDQDTYGAVNQGKREGYKFEIRTVHCPKSGGVDSTVLTVEADGTTTETKPAEETKAPEKAEDLADVDGTEWFAEELTSLIKKGIFTGSLDDGKYSFKAKDEMSTDMLVVLVSRVLDKGLNTTGADWAKEATAWAAEEGLTEGVEAGKVTRKDVILVLWRAAGSPESEASLEKFVDAEGLEGDQLTAMKWAVETGIVKGNDKNELNGDAVIIRSEMVAVIARFDGVVNK